MSPSLLVTPSKKEPSRFTKSGSSASPQAASLSRSSVSASSAPAKGDALSMLGLGTAPSPNSSAAAATSPAREGAEGRKGMWRASLRNPHAEAPHGEARKRQAHARGDRKIAQHWGKPWEACRAAGAAWRRSAPRATENPVAGRTLPPAAPPAARGPQVPCENKPRWEGTRGKLPHPEQGPPGRPAAASRGWT